MTRGALRSQFGPRGGAVVRFRSQFVPLTLAPGGINCDGNERMLV